MYSPTCQLSSRSRSWKQQKDPATRDKDLLIRNVQHPHIPLATIQPPRKRRNVITHRLIKHVQTIPHNLLPTHLRKRSDSKMRSPKPKHRTRRISNGKRLIFDKRRVFSLVRNIVPFDSAVGHLRVKVGCVAERRDGVDVFDGAHGRVLPRVDGVGFRRRGVFVRVFPPKLDVVVLVVEHGVRGCACAPAVAAYAGVAVERGPFPDRHPYVLFLAAVPGVLLKGRVVDCEPDVLWGQCG
jgi:hypothetical protein